MFTYYNRNNLWTLKNQKTQISSLLLKKQRSDPTKLAFPLSAGAEWWSPFQTGHVFTNLPLSPPSPFHSFTTCCWAFAFETSGLILNLERRGRWKPCQNLRIKNARDNEAFIFQWDRRATSKAHGTQCPCDGELTESCWGESVWFQWVWLLPTWDWGHPSCSRRLQLCLFHSGSYQRFIFMNSEHFL